MSALNVGDVVRIEVTDQPYGPEALGRHGGLVVFVDGAAPGDVADVRITELAERHARARLIEVVEPSPDRVVLPCPMADVCGGCQWQHLAYSRQAAAKQAAVRDALERIGRWESPPVEPIVPAQPVLGTRNKAMYKTEMVSGFRAGYYARRSHKLVPLEHCPANLPEMDDALRTASELLRHDAHAEIAGHVTSLGARQSSGSGEVVVRLALDGRIRARNFADDLATACPSVTGVTVIAGSERPIRGSAILTEHVGDLRYPVSAGSFFQGNPFMTPRLVGLVADAARLTGSEAVIDAYGGAGLFSLALAGACASIELVESDRSAVADARRIFDDGPGERHRPCQRCGRSCPWAHGGCGHL